MRAGAFDALQEAVAADPGFRLFTVLAWLPERRVLRRVHSSHPREYPVGGEKTVEVDGGWLSSVVDGQEGFLGPTRDDVRRIFADADLIESLGCDAVVNVPVVIDGRTAAVLNLLDAEGAYDEASLIAAAKAADDAAPSLRAALAQPAAAGPAPDIKEESV